MIASCPQCASRYRIRDEKIQGKGARITCPSCKHRFVVYRESEKFVVGDTGPKGLPVTFARGGQITKAEIPEEDDESEAPTTLMPHGSALAEQFRKTLAARENAEPRAAAEPRPAREATPPQPAAPKAREAPPDLRSQARNAPPRDGPSVGTLALVGAMISAGVAAVLYAAGLLG